MCAGGIFLTIFRLPPLIFLPVILLTALAACGDRGSVQQSEGDTLLPPTQEASRDAVRTTPTPSREEMGMAVNRIAYVGSDGNIFTIKPDGTDSRRLTLTDLRVGPRGHILAQGSHSQVFYAWPTWSPDSTKLAASRITGRGADATFSLEVLDASTGRATKIYDNEPNTLPIARGAPHYTSWSPDSRHLAFIASTPGELILFISTPGEGRGPTPLTGQGPLYFSWADDSNSMIIHKGRQLLLASVPGSGLGMPRMLGTASEGFRPPALSRDATKTIYVAKGEHGDALYVADIEHATQEGSGTQPPGARSVLDVGPFSALLRSPTRDEVAISDSTDAAAGYYARLTLVSSDGTSQKTLANEPLLAFFWAPDGEKIVYVAFDPEQLSFTWKYVTRSGGAPVELVEFSPSAESLTMFSFFDQYAYSNSIWSPDSSQIVFSGTTGASDPSRNGATPEGDKVYVLDVREGSGPREIATSRFAVWSWK